MKNLLKLSTIIVTFNLTIFNYSIMLFLFLTLDF